MSLPVKPFMLFTYVYVPSRVNETHFQAKSLNEDWNCLIGVCAGGSFATPGLLQDYYKELGTRRRACLFATVKISTRSYL